MHSSIKQKLKTNRALFTHTKDAEMNEMRTEPY